mmetsp:Transcript_22598/g.57121  ORF Transcript_22598/g.57121 Transcript_22598/m.57121 type:complete len:89 (+) Transcript_22598:70-336(+)
MVQTSTSLSRVSTSHSSETASASPDAGLIRRTHKSASRKRSSGKAALTLGLNAPSKDAGARAGARTERDFDVDDCFGLSELAFYIEMA